MALVEFSKHGRRARVETVAYAHIEVGLNIPAQAATEAAAKLTKAHEDLARRAAAPPRDDDDDDDDDDKDDDGDDERPAPAPEAPRADEDTDAKLRRLTREAEARAGKG